MKKAFDCTAKRAGHSSSGKQIEEHPTTSLQPCPTGNKPERTRTRLWKSTFGSNQSSTVTYPRSRLPCWTHQVFSFPKTSELRTIYYSKTYHCLSYYDPLWIPHAQSEH
uniref:Uncharacterized protein n=1 Tax=Arundo donax TaxID=35708 RepID=A0A0A9DAK2_ARUDO